MKKKKSLGVLRAPIFPMPLLLIGTYDETGTPNVMTMAWGGVTFNERITLHINRQHKTAQNIRASQAFTVSVATVETLREADFCGIVSANEMPDKVAKSGLHVYPAEGVHAPVIDELPLSVLCRLEEIIEEKQTLHISGAVVDVLADEDVLSADGGILASQLRGVVYDNFGQNYYAIGEKIADARQIGKALLDKPEDN